jgi:hypothetical protein
MAEEVVAGDSPPMTGTLFRYASAEEMLLERDKPLINNMDMSLPEEEYESYVDNALDILECNAVNPLYLDATATPHPTARTNGSSNSPCPSSAEDPRWTDNIGIGALASVTAPTEASPLDDKETMHIDDDEDEDNFFAFEYSS